MGIQIPTVDVLFPGPSAPQPESTGNPMRDLELQRQATASAHARRFDRDDNVDPSDEYSGLMTQRERQWIINIQLSQLKCENPFLVSNFANPQNKVTIRIPVTQSTENINQFFKSLDFKMALKVR